MIPAGSCFKIVWDIDVTCACAALMLTVGWKKILTTPMPGKRLRFDMLDVVDRGRNRALVGRDDPARHVVRRQAGIAPDRRDDRDPDVGKNIRRRSDRGEPRRKSG